MLVAGSVRYLGRTILSSLFTYVPVIGFVVLQAVDVRFIEYMPFADNKWNDKKIVPYVEMLDIIKRKYPKLERLPDKANDTSKVRVSPEVCQYLLS